MSTALSNEATLALSRGPAPSVPGNIFSPQMLSAAGCRAFVAKKCCEEGGPFLSAKVALFVSAVNSFSNVPEPIPMRNTTGATVYYLFFASAKPVAQNIVTDIFTKYQNRGAI